MGNAMRVPGSTPTRLNMSFNVTRCCGPGYGLDVEFHDHLHPELRGRGLSKEVWDAWVEKLDEVQRHGHGCWHECTMCLFCCCRVSGRMRTYQQGLREWQDQFNEVLSPLGMFVKTKAAAVVVHRGNTTSREETQWISIALTPEEVAILQAEPHLEGAFAAIEKQRRVL